MNNSTDIINNMDIIQFLANVKEIRIKTLVSGDKEVKLDLRVVGADIAEANKLANIDAVEQVKITYAKN